MQIKELDQLPDNNKFKFDVVDDAVVFMRNDPTFYRKHYFPAVSKLADIKRSGKNIDPMKHLMPTIEKGCDIYTRKYNLARSPEEVFTNEDRNSILEKIYSEEMDQIEKGEYK